MCLPQHEAFEKISYMIIMKILNMNQFVSERIKVQPITNAELSKAADDMKKNPFGLVRSDLAGHIENFPVGVIVKMIEETQAQRDYMTQEDIINTLQMQPTGAFAWNRTEAGMNFWHSVILDKKFDVFFEKYPEYRKYKL